LNQLAIALESAEEKSTKEIAITTSHGAEIGKEHGTDRANTAGYSVDEVIFEYRILRQVIIQVLEKEHPLSGVEREIITDLIEQSVKDSAAAFSYTLQDMSEQYAATLTHDMRGPLTAAMTSAQMIIKWSNKPDLCVKNATRIVDNLKRMNSMIQNLLDAGRIRAGQRLSVEPTVCDPTALANEVVDEMMATYGDRFVISSDPKLRTWWSSDLFRRALENLLNNAVKYGEPNAMITVKIEQADTLVKIDVHNQGGPIPANEQASLFQKYMRSKSAEISSEKGWGLGLTLVLGVAEAHNGSVHVQSSEGKGTSFVIILPQDCRKESSAKEEAGLTFEQPNGIIGEADKLS
jgi:signal transduction histidine kinase